MNDKFNRLMPESGGSVLCYEITKPISVAGYEENFLKLARQIVKDKGELRVLNYYNPYQGWEEDAAELDIIAHVDLGRYVRKLAFVNAPEKEIMARLIKRPLTSAELRFFTKDQLPDALKWIKE